MVPAQELGTSAALARRDARHDRVMAREIVLDTETTGFDP
jgi:hypothetical protein